MVLLKEPSVVEQIVAATPGEPPAARHGWLDSPLADQFQRAVESSQERLIAQFRESPSFPGVQAAIESLEVVDRTSFLLNMLVVRGSPEAVERLRRHGDVQAVHASRLIEPLLDSAPGIVGAPEFWAALGGPGNAGSGSRIAIVDSGISLNHAMFNGSGMQPPSGFPKGELAFTNGKIIVARSYHELFPKPQNDKTPRDEMGHGSRVAGIAGGRTVDSPAGIIQGIAPMAYLGNYKVFGTPGTNSVTTDAAVTRAINDAVADGMHIINLSLGGTARDPATDPEQLAIRLATEAGVVVVVAAGNAGPGLDTIKTPGTSPHAITVGAVSNGRVFGSALNISADPPPPPEIEAIPYVAAESVPVLETVGPLPLVSVRVLDPSGEACIPFPAGAFLERVALVQRGQCLFEDKARNVFAAGARGLIVFNNADGPALRMNLGAFSPPGPAVMIERNPGLALRDFVESGPETRVTFLPGTDQSAHPSQADVIAGFSSRGPNINTAVTGIKPDLTAIGQNLLTASNSAGQFSEGVNGTSFSSPMVAGAAALVKHLHANWSPQAIKSALVNSAAKTPQLEQETAGLLHTGNGRLDLGAALRVAAMLDPVGGSFGVVEAGATGSSDQRELLLTNLSSAIRTYQISWEVLLENPSVEMSVSPEVVSLQPEESVMITVTARYASNLRGGSFEGYLKVQDDSEATDITASFWGAVLFEEATVVWKVARDGSGDYTTLERAVDRARPGNIIEIADSATYQTALAVHLNREALPLNGLTIRAAAGFSPLIDATGFGAPSVIEIQDLTGVTLQGLAVRGSGRGVSFLNSTGMIRDLHVLSTTGGSANYGIHLSNSRAHLVGNRVQKSGGYGVGLFNAAVLGHSNWVGEIKTGDGTGNSAGGIFLTGGSRLSLFDSVVHGNGGSADSQAVRISGASGLLKGNRISGQRSVMGDGILMLNTPQTVGIQDNLIEANSRYGVALFEDSRASLLRNRIILQAQAGLRAVAQSTVDARALSLLKNGMGIELQDSTLNLSDSVIGASRGSSGDGLSSSGSALKILNTTFASNQGFGVRVSAGGTGQISNSILFANTLGDLAGNSNVALDANLIGDLPAPEEANFSADPLFTAPENDDFSLREGSPAIDQGAGLRSVAETDVLGHARIVDGNQDGTARLDLGAFEFGSIHSTPLMLPVLTDSAGEFVGIALTNALGAPAGSPDPAETAAPVILRAFDQNGTHYASFEQPVTRGRQFSILLAEAFPQLRKGWVEILPPEPDLMSFTLLGNQELAFLDGSQLLPATSEPQVFPEVRGATESTTFFIVNPSPHSVTVRFRWNSGGGAQDAARAVPARGLLESRFAELFGNGQGGFVTFWSEQGTPLFGLEIFGTAIAKGGLTALPLSSREIILFGAQLAWTGELDTVINLLNVGPSDEIRLEAVNDQGESLAAAVVQLDSDRQFRRSARELFGQAAGQTFVGWLRVTSVSAGLMGSLSFEHPAGDFLAALPLQGRGFRECIFSHVAQTPLIFTGVTLLNPFSEATPVSLEVFDRLGTRVGMAFLDLESGRKQARLLNEYIAGLDQQEGGYIRVRSVSGIVGFELFGNLSLDFLSAVPAQVTVY